ncbi:metalloprotease mig-17-like [Gigantopelta aegis]|uniref:metalloprotease mig-17-like n=1 Tax=Gigantopelta aegis TaxID=1735272 RepID=UPI001B88911D|nr:metalloprotease mig-17-like [Gigantopelta aegis]
MCSWLRRNNNNGNLAKAEMNDYYVNIVNAANTRYKSVTRGGFRVQLLINAIIIADTPSLSPWTQNLNVSGVIQAGRALDDFSLYVEKSGGQLGGVPFDHVALITGFNLASGPSRGTAGIAYLRAVCRTYTVSVTEELYEELTALVLAHEIGHSLGSEHDGTRNTCKGSDQFVMAARLRIPPSSKATNPWHFSSCSVTQFRSFLQTSRTACTLSRQGHAIDVSPFLQQEFGQKYPPDIQCEIYLGSGSKLCRALYFAPNVLRYDSICRLLYCYRPATRDCVPVSAHDGTSCGDRLWCQSGVCVFSAKAPSRPLNCPAGDDPDVRCTLDLCTIAFLNDQLCCATCKGPRPTNKPRPTMSGGMKLAPTQSVGIFPVKPTQSVGIFPVKPTQSVMVQNTRQRPGIAPTQSVSFQGQRPGP